MFEADNAFKGQFSSFGAESGNSDTISKHIMDVAKIGGFRRDRQRELQDVLVKALTRPKHHPVFPKEHRVGIAKGCQMSNCKDIHLASAAYTAAFTGV